MTLIKFLPDGPGRCALAGSAMAMTVPALVTVQVQSLCESTSLAGPGMGMAATFSLVPLAIGAMGWAWWRSERERRDLIQRTRLREAELSHQAEHDSLTGLRNRLALRRDVESILARPTLPGEAILLLDLDRFKYINDTLGHDTGDELLVSLARRMEAVLAPSDRLYRLGGDEFVILVGNPRSRAEIDAFCRLVEDKVFRPHDLSKGRVATGVSIGIAFLRKDDDGLSSCLKRADLALYKAKDVPGSAHVFYNPTHSADALARIELERDMARALSDDEFFLEYQPIVGVPSGAVRSFEALLRWCHPDKGILQPHQFVPLAESSGMIVPLGRWVLRKACLEAAKWPSPTGIAVNVAGVQFKDATFVDHVSDCLREAQLAPGRLTIEVTESIFSIEISRLADRLAELRKMGVRIALDDFGTGFSSINNLKTFPLDQLKIDRSFTAEMLANKRDAEIVDLIRRLGDTFQVATTIEGIETESQLDLVRDMGVSEAQGFLISKPLPAREVQAFFQSRKMPASSCPQALSS